MYSSNIFQDILSSEQIEKFTISKFLKEKDISVICDKQLAEKLIDSVKAIEFNERNIKLDEDIEYVVTKIENQFLICEYAKNENGEYLNIEAPVIVITIGDKISISNFDKFIAIDGMYILGSAANGLLVSKLGYYIEFGEIGDDKKNGKFRYEY